MERDHHQKKKRSRAVEGGSSGRPKKDKERKGKDIEIEPTVVVAEDEVEEFFAILRRMQQAAKYYDKGKATTAACVKLPDPLPEVNDDDGVKKTTDVALFDLNSLPDDEE